MRKVSALKKGFILAAGFKLLMAVFAGLVISFAGLSCDCMAAKNSAHDNMSAHASHDMQAMPVDGIMDGMGGEHQCEHGCDDKLQTVSSAAVLTLAPAPAAPQIDLALSTPGWVWQNENRLADDLKGYSAPWHAPPDKTPVTLKTRLLT